MQATEEGRPYGEEVFWHRERATCPCGAQVEWDADCLRWWVRYEYGNPPEGAFTCPDG